MRNIKPTLKSWKKIFAAAAMALFLSEQLLWAGAGFDNLCLLRPLSFSEREKGTTRILQDVLSNIPDIRINEWIENGREWSAPIEIASGTLTRQYNIRIKGNAGSGELVISIESGDNTAQIRLRPDIDLMQHPELTAFIEKCNERYEKEYGDDYELADKLLWLHWMENKGVQGAGDFDPVDFMYAVSEQLCRREGRDYILLEAWHTGGLIKAIDWGFRAVDPGEKKVFSGYIEAIGHARAAISDKSARARYYSEHLPGQLRMTLSKELELVPLPHAAPLQGLADAARAGKIMTDILRGLSFAETTGSASLKEIPGHLRPLSLAESNGRGLIVKAPDRAAAVSGAIGILSAGMEKINALTDEEVSKLPAGETEQALPHAVWLAYYDLIAEACEAGKGIPEFDRLKEEIRGGHYSQTTVTGALSKVFLESGVFILFGQRPMEHLGRHIADMPVLMVNAVNARAGWGLNFVGVKMQGELFYIEDEPMVRSIGAARIVATAIPEFTIDGKIPVIINDEAILRQLLNYYSDRLFVERTGAIADKIKTGNEEADAILNAAMADLLRNQWPEFSEGAQKFADENFNDFMFMIIVHELMHVFVGATEDERFSYFLEMTATRFSSLTLYKVIRNAYIRNGSYSVTHLNASAFFLSEFLPGIFQRKATWSIPEIDAGLRQAAAIVHEEGPSAALFAAIPQIPIETLRRAGLHEFINLLADWSGYLQGLAAENNMEPLERIRLTETLTRVRDFHGKLLAAARPVCADLTEDNLAAEIGASI